MIRVLQMIGSLNIGGSQTMIMNIYRNIDRSLIQFDFIIDHPNELYFKDEIESLGGKVFVMPSFTVKNLSEIKKAWNLFFDNHQEYKVLHSHVRSYASVFIPIAKKHGLKTIIHSHSTSNGNGAKALIKTLLQYKIRYVADYFMSCSYEAGQWLFGKKIASSGRLIIIKNAIKLRDYKYDPAARAALRTELGIPESSLVFIHVGRFHPSKNHDFLISLFDRVKANPDYLLLLVGDGELREHILELITKYSLSDKVILAGARSDVSRLLNCADCLLFPSAWEGLPMSVIEAQASGMPCLISDHITKEVMISPLVKALPISDGVEPWVYEIERLSFDRKDVSRDIIEAGFDISSSVSFLTDFYLNVCQ